MVWPVSLTPTSRITTANASKQSPLQLAAEYDGAGTLVARYVYGTKVNVPEYMIRDGQTYRLVTDHLGSVRMVVNVNTGVVAQRIDYDEFGKATLVTGTWDVQPFGFAGGLHDPDTALVRFGARDYDAETGRWTAKDPILFNGGDLNLFGYVLGDPINRFDLLGLNIGDPLPNMDQAAMDALSLLVPTADVVEFEFSGVIYEKGGFFYATYAQSEGEVDTSTAAGIEVPEGGRMVALYHNHPLAPGYDGENFSWEEKDHARSLHWAWYVATPSGRWLRYHPWIGVTELLGCP